ncbi:MAG: RNA polymerase sigma-54 factor [Bacteroidetes bacterium]|nr:MAG: RNA polymerase sigma-54 factor [Bacteroidota bacterium]RLD57568.1 MAG: RNA polymerase sigma-54 factor [Bacteroidota bacterium]RLD80926.1 MAG: RNA polymerase sigma-54 factor [Bacteroidota bacterium]
MLNQRLQQKLLQKLSPQQILLMKLLQIPSMALEQRIKQEIEENPALEEASAAEEDQDEAIDGDDTRDENPEDEYDSKEDEFDLDDYMQDDEIPSYKTSINNQSSDDERKDIPYASGLSFQDMLLSQLGLRMLTDEQKVIAETIIGNLDDSGYLQREISAMVDDLAFAQNINVSDDEILEILKVVQEFDPAGIGARNLQECLLIQLRRKQDEDHPAVGLAIIVLENHFNEFVKKHYDKIMKKAKINEDELKGALAEVLKLNPKPGNSLSETTKTIQYVIPDFIIHNTNGDLELSLNSRNAPELRLSHAYTNMMEAYAENKKDKKKKEAFMFIKQKIDSAKWFMEAIRQRQNTLFVTMNAIMEFQRNYFLTGDETKLRPMILKDIADIVNLDISTISRVANSKYVQTPFGTFLLKSFFSESMQTESGEEVSTREIKKILSECIDSENKTKPHTDELLTNILKEKGYNIARRTVAKYREQLNIPVARLRKEL